MVGQKRPPYDCLAEKRIAQFDSLLRKDDFTNKTNKEIKGNVQEWISIYPITKQAFLPFFLVTCTLLVVEFKTLKLWKTPGNFTRTLNTNGAGVELLQIQKLLVPPAKLIKIKLTV